MNSAYHRKLRRLAWSNKNNCFKQTNNKYTVIYKKLPKTHLFFISQFLVKRSFHILISLHFSFRFLSQSLHKISCFLCSLSRRFGSRFLINDEFPRFLGLLPARLFFRLVDLLFRRILSGPRAVAFVKTSYQFRFALFDIAYPIQVSETARALV